MVENGLYNFAQTSLLLLWLMKVCGASHMQYKSDVCQCPCWLLQLFLQIFHTPKKTMFHIVGTFKIWLFLFPYCNKHETERDSHYCLGWTWNKRGCFWNMEIMLNWIKLKLFYVMCTGYIHNPFAMLVFPQHRDAVWNFQVSKWKSTLKFIILFKIIPYHHSQMTYQHICTSQSAWGRIHSDSCTKGIFLHPLHKFECQ